MKHAIKEKIRNEYVHGYLNEEGYRVMPTLDELIRKYDVPASSTYRASSKEGWKKQKEAFLEHLRGEIDAIKSIELQDKLFVSEKYISEITYELFLKALKILRESKSLSPNGLASLAHATLTTQKIHLANKPSVHPQEENDAFMNAMEILDELEAMKRAGG